LWDVKSSAKPLLAAIGAEGFRITGNVSRARPGHTLPQAIEGLRRNVAQSGGNGRMPLPPRIELLDQADLRQGTSIDTRSL
jgi:hypothetical protein